MYILSIVYRSVFGAAQIIEKMDFWNGCLLFFACCTGAEKVGDTIALLVRGEIPICW